MSSIPVRCLRALLVLTALPALAGSGAVPVDRPPPFDPRGVVETVRRNRGEAPRPAAPNFAPAGAAPFAQTAGGAAILDPRFKIALESGELVGRLPDGRVGVRVSQVEFDGALPALRHAPGAGFAQARPGLLRRALAGGVSAHLLNRGRDGLEMYWRLDERLDGPLGLTLRLLAPAAPRAESRGLTLPGPGGARFTLTHLSAVDADGRRLEIRPAVAAGGHAGPDGLREYRLRYEIPAGFLAAARYPVVLDPTLGVEFPVDANPVTGVAPGTQGNPSVAWNGADFLVVWQDDRAGSGTDIFAARVQPNGTLRDPAGLLVSGATGNQLDPVAASVSTAGGSWLVVWRDFRNGTDSDLYDALVNGDGSLGATQQLAGGAGNQSEPALAAVGTTYVAAWTDNPGGSDANIAYARLNATANVAGSAAISAGAANENNPSVTRHGVATALIGWADYRSGTSYDIYTTRVNLSDDSLGDPAGVAIVTGAGDQTRSALARTTATASASRVTLAVWEDYRAGAQSDLYGRRVNLDGTLNGAEFTIAGATGSERTPALAGTDTGFLAAWSVVNVATGDDARGVLIAPDTTLGTPFTISGGTAGETEPALATSGSDFFAVWQDGRGADPDIWGARISAAGAVLDAGGVIVSASRNLQAAPAVASNGTLWLVAWEDYRAGSADVYCARVDANGAPVDATGVAVSTAAGAQRLPRVASNGTHFLVVWEDHRAGAEADVYASRVLASGAPGSIVLDAAGIAVSAVAGSDQGAPAVASTAGGYLVIWQDGRGGNGASEDIWAARVQSDGVVADAAGISVTTATGRQTAPAIATSGSDYVAVWQDTRGGADSDIYGRLITGGGTPQGADIALSTAVGDQLAPAIAGGSGGYLAAWQGPGPTDVDIRAIRLSAGGGVQGSAFPISAATGDQSRPALSADGTDYFAVWQDPRGGATLDVYGARVLADGTVVEPAGLLLEQSPYNDLSPAAAHLAAGTYLIAYQRFYPEPGYNTDRVLARMLRRESGDLFVAVSNGVSAVVPGNSPSYTITAGNAGPDAITGATLTLGAPALTGVSWTCTASGGASCPASGVGQPVLTSDFPAGGLLTVVMTGAVPPNLTGTLTVTAALPAPYGVNDPAPTNNGASDADPLTPQADLAITKLDAADPVDVGANIYYTLTVTNYGPSDAAGVAVTDALPAGVTLYNPDQRDDDNSSAGFGGGAHLATTWDIANLNLTLDAAGMSAGTGGFTSRVMDGGVGATWTGFQWTPRRPYSKALPGGKATETAYAAGNAAMTGNLLLLHLDETAGATNAADASGDGRNVTCTAPNCPTFGVAGRFRTAAAFDGTNDRLSVADAPALRLNTFSMSFWFKVDAAAPARTVYLTGKQTEHYEVSLQVGAGGAVTQLTFVASLSQHTLVQANSGFRAGWNHAVVSYDGTLSTIVLNGGSPITTNRNGNTDDLTLDNAPLVLGNRGALNATEYFQGALDEFALFNRVLTATEAQDHYRRGAQRLRYQLRACGQPDCADGAFAGPDGTAATYYTEELNGATGLPVLALGAVPAGRYFQYRATLETDDAAVAPRLLAVEVLPPHNPLIPSQGSCVTGPPVSCALGALARGASASIQVIVVANASGAVSNSASVAATTPDPASGNNSATQTTQVNQIAHLSIVKTDSRTQTEAGLPVTYTITASNAGPSAVTGARVNDALPVTLQNASWLCSASGGGACPVGGSGSISNALIDLPAGASAVFTLSAQVSPTATGTLNNTATVTPPAGTTDPLPGDNSSTDSDQLVQPPPPSISAYAPVFAAYGGRAAQTATLLHDGHILFAGGSTSFTSGDGLDTGVVYDPLAGASLAVANVMADVRMFHTATLLPTGRVLIAGGQPHQNQAVASASLYIPATNQFAATGAMNRTRFGHTATLLLDGRVLIVGGRDTNAALLNSAELYDPATGAFTLLTADTLATARVNHTATLLPDGRVLIAGGVSSGTATATAGVEIYDPAASGSAIFTASGSLGAARAEHSATLLEDGRVIVAGGRASGATLASLEGWSGGVFTPLGAMLAGRYAHNAVLLPDSRLLLAGGSNAGGTLSSLEIFSPVTNGITAAGVGFTTPRFTATATLLTGGGVLFAGGYGGSNTYFDTAERYNPPPEGRSLLAGAVVDRRIGHRALAMPDGSVLIVGGRDGAALSSKAERYDPVANTFTTVANDPALARTDLTLTLLINGRVFIAGGRDAGGVALASVRVFDPETDTLSTPGAGTLTCARADHVATQLPSGKILLSGGCAAGANADLFDPFFNTFTSRPMVAQRAQHAALLMPGGKVLITGGQNGGVAVAASELYDPENGPGGTFTAGPNLLAPRFDHAIVLLATGKVWVAGGTSDGTALPAASELYDPAAPVPAFTAATPLASPRRGLRLIALPSNFVAVVGGRNGGGPLNAVELYHPAGAGTMASGGTLSQGRYGHSATLLGTGRILVAGGTADGTNAVGAAELFGASIQYAAGRRPQITAYSLSLPGPLLLTGNRFRGGTEATSGQNYGSSTGFPTVRVQRFDNGFTRYLLPDGTTPWNDGAFTSQVINTSILPFGYYRMNVIANGIPSADYTLQIPYNAPAVSPQQPPNGEATVPYTYQPLVTGGFGTFSWTITGLPSGLSYSPTTGYISGTPTVSGPVTLTVTVTDALGLTNTRTLNTFTIYPALTITTFSLPNGTVGLVYSPPAGKTITTSGGAPGKLFSISGGLTPSGLVLSPAGVISGIPLAPGSVTFTVQVTDSLGKIVTRPYTIGVTQPLGIANTALAVGVLGETYPFTALQAAGGFPQYSYSLASGPLPPGLNLSISGLITGTPTATGPYPVSFRVTDSTNATATRAYTMSVTVPSDINGWAPRGQFGGKIQQVEISPDYLNDGVVFVLSETGELFRSADRGLTWTRSLVNTGKAYNATNRIALSPVYSGASASAAGRTLFFLSFEIGIWKSTDHGASFAPSNTGLPCTGTPCYPQLTGLALSPDYESDGRAWAIDFFGTVFRTADGGGSWSQLSSGQLPAQSGLRTPLAVSPAVASDGILFAAFGNTIHRSANGGANWTLLFTALDADGGVLNFQGLAISPGFASDHILLAETETFRLFRTRNAGASFADISTPASNYGQHLSVVPRAGLAPRWFMESPNANAFVYKLLYSDDYGSTFTAFYASGMSSGSDQSYALAAAPWDAGAAATDFYYGTESGLYASFDAGFTFVQRDEGLNANIVHDVSGSGDEVAAAYKGGWFKSVDAGDSRVRLSPPDSTGTVREVYFSAVSPDYANDSVIFLGDALGLWRSADGGQSFEPVSGLGGSTDVMRHAFVPGFSGVNGTLFVGNDTGLYRSDDGGGSFYGVPLSAICGGPSPVVIDLAVSPNFATDATLFTVSAVSGSNGGLCASADGGANWTQRLNGAALVAGPIALSPVYNGAAGVNGTPSRTLMVGHYRTTDGGASWLLVNGGPVNGNGAPVFSPNYALDAAVFLHADGVWRSLDGGVNFAPSTAGAGGCPADQLGTRTVSGLYLPADYTPSAGNVVAATAGSGVWRSANGGATFCIVTETASISAHVNDIVRVPGSAALQAGDARTPAPPKPAAVSAPGAILAATGGQGVFQSDDGGVTFRNISAGLPANADARAIGAPSAAPARPLAAVDGQGVWRYDPGAARWIRDPGYDTGNYTSFYEASGWLFATRADGRSLRSSDGGANWEELDPAQTDLVKMAFNDATSLTTASQPGGEQAGPRQTAAITAPLWAVSLAQGPRWSANAGASWTAAPGVGDYQLPSGQTYKVIQPLGLNPSSGGREVLAGSTTELFRTLDGGVTWRAVAGSGSGLEASSKNFAAVLSSPTAFGTTDVLVGATGTTTGGVYLSGDGGEHWVQVNQGFDPNSLSISTLVKTSCAGCPVQYYSGSFGGGIYTRTIAVLPPPALTPAASGGWCFGSTGCACSTAAGSGPSAGGQPFRICGANFQAGALVEFDGIPAAGCVTTGGTVITCTGTPAHVAGYATLRVRNPDTRVGYCPALYSFTGGVSRTLDTLRVAKSGDNAALAWTCTGCTASNPARIYRAINPVFTANLEIYNGGVGTAYLNVNALAAASSGSYFWSVE